MAAESKWVELTFDERVHEPRKGDEPGQVKRENHDQSENEGNVCTSATIHRKTSTDHMSSLGVV